MDLNRVYSAVDKFPRTARDELVPVQHFGGHLFQGVQVSDRATAIFGDVYTSSADLIPNLNADHERRVLTNALRYQGMTARLDQIRTATPDTCSWIWDTPFQQWLENGSSDIFWISGKPGSGKSTLMKHLVADPKTKKLLPPLDRGQSWTLVHFFFDFRAASGLANTETGLFRSILYQLVKALPVQSDILTECGIQVQDILDSPHGDRIVESIVRLLDYTQMAVIIFMDGLDECGSNLRLMIQSIKSIHSRIGVRMCLASRPEPLLQLLLKGCPGIMVQEHNRPGILSYIETTYEEIASSLMPQSVSIDSIIKLIIDKADGLFIWVYFSMELVIERIVCGCTEQELRQELDQLPLELGSMYDRILARIPPIYRTEASMVLRLLESAQHVVDLELLFAACASIQATLGSSIFRSMNIEHFKTRLHGFLGGLVDFKRESAPLTRDTTAADHYSRYTFTGLEVRLLHETLRSYIRNNESLFQWTDVRLQRLYPDHLWFRLYCSTISKCQDILKEKVWDAMDRVYTSKKWPRSQIPDIFQVVICSIWPSTDHSNEQYIPPRLACRLLDASISDVCNIGRQIRIREEHLELHTTTALQSPLMLFHDILDIKKSFQEWNIIQPHLSTNHRDWRHDLSFATARGWLEYLQIHSASIYDLSRAERRFLLSCLLQKRTTLRLILPERNFEISHTIDSVLNILLVDGSFEVAHVVLYLCGTDDEQVPKYLQNAVDQKKTILGQSTDAIMTVTPLDYFPFLNRRDLHVLELWAQLRHHSKRFFSCRMALLRQIGVDVLGWRRANGSNLAHAVIDICTTLGDYHGMFLKLNILMDVGVDFSLANASGKSAWTRSREMMFRVSRLNSILPRSDQKKLNPRNEDVIDGNEKGDDDEDLRQTLEAGLIMLDREPSTSSPASGIVARVKHLPPMFRSPWESPASRLQDEA